MCRSFLFLLLSIFIWSCNDSDKTEPPTLTLGNKIVNFEVEENSKDITIITNVADWTASTSADWCTVTTNKGTGANSITIKSTANTNLEKRTATIIIVAETLREEITVTQLGENPEILLSLYTSEVEAEGTSLEITVTSNIEYNVLNTLDWIEINETPTTHAMVGKPIYLSIKDNTENELRKGSIIFSQKSGNAKGTLNITQKGAELIIIVLEDDIKHKPTGGVASTTMEDRTMAHTYDDDYLTYFNSKAGVISNWPFHMDYTFSGVEALDYIIYYSRKDNGTIWGSFGKFEIWAKTEANSQWVKYGDFDASQKAKSSYMAILSESIIKPTDIRFAVLDGFNNRVSCGEMEFYQTNPKNVIDTEIFTDNSCSALTPGVTLKKIRTITDPLLKNIALKIHYKIYDTKYRAAKYKAVILPSVTSSSLKIGAGFSSYENITGMYLEKGENIVYLGNTKGKSVSLILPDLDRQPTPGFTPSKDPNGWGLKAQRIPLKEGANLINVTISTNAYISYYDNNPEAAPEITVHFATGKVNGYFDVDKQTNAEWNSLLDNAVSHTMDAKGKYIHVAYPVRFFKQYAYSKGVELISNYDKILLNHYQFMGLEKYKKMPQNRIFSRVNFNYYMFRDGDGVAYMGDASTMKKVVDPAMVVSTTGGGGAWGFCHEVGHVLQMPNHLNWRGLGEVSNNLFSMYTTTAMGNASNLKNNNMYVKARKSIIEANRSYLPRVLPEEEKQDDVFESLVPFWQLHLYFSRNGLPSFYGDLMEVFRDPNLAGAGTGNNSYKNQFVFMKLACDVGKTDLTDFFDKWGFFYAGTINVTDYGGPYKYVISQEEVDEVRAAIAAKGYPKPKVDITTLED